MIESPLLQMISALAFVLALMGLLALILKRFGLNGPVATPVPGTTPRLRILEILSLSPQHRALIIARDDTQHLVILGPNGETVVETGIKATLPHATPSHDHV